MSMPAEVAKFSDLGPPLVGSWRVNSSPLHQINPLRLAWIQEFSAAGKGLNVLDVGCGGGILSDAMARKWRGACWVSIMSWQGAEAWHNCMPWRRKRTGVTYREVNAEALADEQAGPVSMW
jgi:2-polyprenyl-6-hydroxyphenyl methylase/3-demethylubiquinone-9 3-methyltransferase